MNLTRSRYFFVSLFCKNQLRIHRRKEGCPASLMCWVIAVLAARSISYQNAVIIGLEDRQALASDCISSSGTPQEHPLISKRRRSHHIREPILRFYLFGEDNCSLHASLRERRTSGMLRRGRYLFLLQILWSARFHRRGKPGLWP